MSHSDLWALVVAALIGAAIGLQNGHITAPPQQPTASTATAAPEPEPAPQPAPNWIQPCQYEDSIGCYWLATERGNGTGQSTWRPPDGTQPIQCHTIEECQHMANTWTYGGLNTHTD